MGSEASRNVDVRPKIGWLVASLNFEIASTRYRAVYPAAGLAENGFECVFFDRPEKVRPVIGELAALVIVKRLDPGLIHIVSLANDVGTPVILDLCDDVLSIDYRDEAHEMYRMVFDAVAPRLSMFVTTGDVLADRFAAYGLKREKIRIIPDCVESEAVITLAENFLERQLEMTGPAVSRTSTDRLKRAGGILLRAAKALRHPRRSALDIRRTLDTIRYGEPFAPRKKKEAAAEQDPDLRKALALGTRTVVWFGNHGGPHSDFGMLTLLKVADDLRQTHDRTPFTLIVISDSKEKWKLFIEPLGIPTRFVSWTQAGCRNLLERASAFVMPIGDDSFSLSKSANRALLALEAGAPVVSQPLRSLDELDLVTPSSGFGQALEYCLTEKEAARATAADQNRRAHELYGLRRTVELWRTALADAKPYVKQRARYGLASEPERLLVMINLAQDLPLALPIIDEARRRGVETSVIVGAEAARGGAAVLDALVERKIAPTYMPANAHEKRDFRWLRSATALFCPTESSAPAHRLSHALTKIANAAGVATFTAQHGLENIGLTYRDDAASVVALASNAIFTWADPSGLPDWLSPEVRQRCVGVGRIAHRALLEARASAPSPDGPPIVAVFENLHWDRYPNSGKSAFIDQLRGFAAARADLRVVVMAHPGGLWGAKLSSIELPSNVEIVDPRVRERGRWTTPSLIAAARAVITTPSTIAADAAEIGAPVAIAGLGLSELGAYAPLIVLGERVDWTTFVDAALAGERSLNDREFLRRIRLPNDPIEGIVERMCRSSQSERVFPSRAVGV